MQDSPCTAAIRVGCARAGLAVVQNRVRAVGAIQCLGPRGPGAPLGVDVLRTWERLPLRWMDFFFSLIKAAGGHSVA